jgi:hypothetical protein
MGHEHSKSKPGNVENKEKLSSIWISNSSAGGPRSKIKLAHIFCRLDSSLDPKIAETWQENFYTMHGTRFDLGQAERYKLLDRIGVPGEWRGRAEFLKEMKLLHGSHIIVTQMLSEYQLREQGAFLSMYYTDKNAETQIHFSPEKILLRHPFDESVVVNEGWKEISSEEFHNLLVIKK